MNNYFEVRHIVNLFYGTQCSFCGRMWNEDDIGRFWCKTTGLVPDVISCSDCIEFFYGYVEFIRRIIGNGDYY